MQGLVGAPQHNGKEGLLLRFIEDRQRWRYTCSIFPVLIIFSRWSVEVGEPELLAVKPANLVSLSMPVAAEKASGPGSGPAARGGSPVLRTYASTVGIYAILLLPDGTIACDGSVGFDGRDSSPPPAPVAFSSLALEAQLAVCCSNVMPSAAQVHSILSYMPPATVNVVRVPGISFTLLEFAARNGQLQVVEVLLSFGADVNIQTPCLWAAYTGHIQIIEAFMQHGAVPARERGFDGVSRSNVFIAHCCGALLI